MKVFKPGFICKIEKKVAWTDQAEKNTEKKSLFEMAKKTEIEGFSEFLYHENLAKIERFFFVRFPKAVEFSESNIYSPQSFADFVIEYFYKDRTELISSISYIVKYLVLGEIVELGEQMSHTKFTYSKYKITQKKCLKQKMRIEVNLKAEYDLVKEKEKLQELLRYNRPFLNVGFTGMKNSKHAVCVENQKKKDIKSKIEEKTNSLELQINMAQSIWEKNLKTQSFKSLKLLVNYKKKLQSLIKTSFRFSLIPLGFYLFTAWISFTRLQKEKKTCVKLAKSAMQIQKTLRVFRSWKNIADRPKKLLQFEFEIGSYMTLRKLSRLFISWKWFKAYKKLKDLMKILSDKVFTEKLKIQKFFEFKTEVQINRGTRDRYLSLAKGEENDFNKDFCIREARHSFNLAIRKLFKSLNKFKEEIFLQAQESLSIQMLISNSQYYPEQCENWRRFLSKKYNK